MYVIMLKGESVMIIIKREGRKEGLCFKHNTQVYRTTFNLTTVGGFVSLLKVSMLFQKYDF